MVVIAGTNGGTMSWTGPTPLWTWTYYEVDLTPEAFHVDQATFDGIMAGVSELRILGEFADATESVGLDNVVITETPPTVFTNDLRSTFTSGTRERWGIVDDAHLSVTDEGRPSFGLRASDIQVGETFKVVSPTDWAGDWRNFTEVRFDLKWTSTSDVQNYSPMLTLFGANGVAATWGALPVRDEWQHYVVPLTPEAFGAVNSNLFSQILSHVVKIWIWGEFNAGGDTTWFDNVTVSSGPYTPRVHTTSLVSRFGSSGEGWAAFDNATFSWDATGGFLGSGAAKVVDNGTGTARFQSPDSWAGDWSAFAALRFMVHQTGVSDYGARIWIADFNGNVLAQTLNPPLRLWTPYTVDLTPEAFGTNAAFFDTVMSNVACLWINSDLDTGDDTTWLDEVSLLPSTAPSAPVERYVTFDTDAEGWTAGNLSSGGWAPPSAVHWYYDSSANPPGCVVNGDSGTGTQVFYSPAAWSGDWRGHQSIAFDMKVVQGSTNYLSGPGAMLWLCSAHGDLVVNCRQVPSNTGWKRYEFGLTPIDFGVTPEQYDRIARDVAMLAIRSEWLSGATEREAMDNVVVSTNQTAYWTWLGNYFDPVALRDPAVSSLRADPDHDSADNWDEFLAGTAPNQINFLRIERIFFTNATCVIEFNSATAHLYSVECTDALSPANTWRALTNEIPGTGLLMTIPVGDAAHAEQFYRLKAWRTE
jgi:hypothetical protein